MQPISGILPNAAPSAVAGVREAPNVRQSAPPARAQRPARDEYVPEKAPEPSGRYWPGRAADGTPKVYFDDPERPAGDRAESCTCNTDRVDRELAQLKKRRETLEQQLDAAPDGPQAAKLSQKLAQAENELRQKDNDPYRRAHAVFS